VFVLVRHAHAYAKRRWTGPDDERPLSRRGEEQARDLVPALVQLGATRLLSSPTLRCRQTLQPASEELWVPVQPISTLAVDAQADELLELLSSAEVRDAALCTHGETLRVLSQAWQPLWRETTRSPPPDVSGTPKGGCWVVENYGTPEATAHFLGRPTRLTWR
jgi:8-oxo-dGTP diphosphatase